jgi:hypothetical protein
MKPDKPKKDEEVVLTLDDIEDFESPDPILPKDDEDEDMSSDED